MLTYIWLQTTTALKRDQPLGGGTLDKRVRIVQLNGLMISLMSFRTL